MSGPQVSVLPGGRLHMNHGPIDLVVFAEGAGKQEAFVRAARRFETVLVELMGEIAPLRAAVARPVQGNVARRMMRAVEPYRTEFVTAMAAVAGAVADEILAALCDGHGIERAYVNNGGDIAMHLASGQKLAAAIADSDGVTVIHHHDPVRGVATSGWRGRSQSLGIADAVTVLARDAASADAAATMIANAVDLPGHPAIRRMAAHLVKADSDLGDLPVTMAVGPLTRSEVSSALERGLSYARDLMARDLIAGAALFLQSETRIIGPLPALKEPAHA